MPRNGHIAAQLAEEGRLPFSAARVNAYFADRATQDFPVVHHSAFHEAAYDPA